MEHVLKVGAAVGRWCLLEPHINTWVCQCTCGVIRAVSSHALKYGRSKSCGCRAVELHKSVMSRAVKGAEHVGV